MTKFDFGDHTCLHDTDKSKILLTVDKQQEELTVCKVCMKILKEMPGQTVKEVS